MSGFPMYNGSIVPVISGGSVIWADCGHQGAGQRLRGSIHHQQSNMDTAPKSGLSIGHCMRKGV